MQGVSTENSELSDFYDEAFYQKQMDGSYKSARKYVACLSQIYTPKRVADVGCGRGTWLKAFKEGGATQLFGFDGVWNSQSNMVDQDIVFTSTDLNKRLPKQAEKLDLAISLEVAEHIEASSAKIFVENLTNLSDVVLFGAAFKGQGGANHINEQPHSYWAAIFAEYSYMPYDIFRTALWEDKEIDYWYRQNSFLYVKQGSAASVHLSQLGYKPIINTAFMNCIHPELFEDKLYYAKLDSLSGASIYTLLKQIVKRLLV